MKLYKLYLGKPLLIFYVVMLAVFVSVGVVGIVVGAIGKLSSEGPPVWVFVILLGFALFNAYMWLRLPDMSGLESRALDGCVEVAYADGEHMRFLLQSCGFLLLTFMVASCERHRSIGCPHDATLKTYKQWKESTRFPYIAPRARQEQIANNIEKVGVGSTKKDFVEVLGEPDYEEEMYPKEPD